ncbi:MAG: hypothetical protein M3461_14350 [Pseudomonadota bacterium]|nr:hypothetical protein [Pseudomonadota bacterium]
MSSSAGTSSLCGPAPIRWWRFRCVRSAAPDAGRTQQLEYLNDAAACLRDGRVGLRQLAGSVLATLPESARILLEKTQKTSRPDLDLALKRKKEMER